MKRIFYLAGTLFWDLYVWLVQLLLSLLPVHMATNYLRGFLLRPALGSSGKKLQIGSGVIINHPKSLRVGARCYISHNCYIQAKGKLTLGDDVIIGPMCIVATGNHVIEQGKVTNKGVYRPITVGSGTWIGGNSTITSGVEIAQGVVVGAGSVVTKSLTESGIYGGVPARLIK